MSDLDLISPRSKAKVFQSNLLIKARYSMKPTQHRMLLMAFSQVGKTDVHFRPYPVDLREYKRLVGKKHKGSYSELKELAEGLLDQQYEMQKENGGWTKGNFISNIDYEPQDETLYFEFDNKLEKYLLDLKTQYTSFDLLYAIQPSSINSQRFYQLIKSYQHIMVAEIKIDDLRESLALEDKYKNYNGIKENVILKAKTHLDEDCDLTFKVPFKEIKKGNKVVAIKLELEVNHRVIGRNLLENDGQKDTPLIEELKNCGLTHKQVKEILALKEETEIRTKLDYVLSQKAQGKIHKNLTGYLWKTLKADSNAGNSEFRKQKEDNLLNAESNREKNRTLIALEQKKIEALKQQFNKSYEEEFTTYRTKFEGNPLSEEWKEFEEYARLSMFKNIFQGNSINPDSSYYEPLIKNFIEENIGEYNNRFIEWAHKLYGYYLIEDKRYSSGYKIETEQAMLL